MRTVRILACLALFAVPLVPTAIAPAAAQGAGDPSLPGKGAPSAEALAAARDLVAVVMSNDTIHQMSAQMVAQIWPSIEHSLRTKQSGITPEQVADLRGEYERIFVDYLNNAMADAPALYARYFTAAEMREMVVFHRSPTGQKALRLLPLLTAELFQI